MPETECYFEVGTLQGRTAEAASMGNPSKVLVTCDPGDKYLGVEASPFPDWVDFRKATWQEVLASDGLKMPVGVAFYDGKHTARATSEFMVQVESSLADEAVLVLDDWDRGEVRDGAFSVSQMSGRDCWQLLREMPSYGDGISCPPDHFGYWFGVSVWGFRR